MLRTLNFKVLFSLFFLMLSFIFSNVDIPADEQGTANIREPNEIRLAAWNIERLGWGGKYERSDPELKDMAKILSQYDFIAITELMGDTTQFKEVLKKLSKMKYEYCSLVSKPVGSKNNTYRERYAFLYRKGLVKLVDKGNFYPDSDIDNDGNDDFNRNPYWASFRAGNFDFTVVVVHIRAGDMDDDPRSENELLKSVFEDIQDTNGDDENDVILVGDFNMSPDDHGFRDLAEKVKPKVTELIQPPKKTTITDTGLYDNIFLQTEYLTEYTSKKESGVDCFDEDMFGNNDEKAGRISNHRPVWADFRIDLEDDDPINNTGTENCHLHDVGSIQSETNGSTGDINNDPETIEPDSQSESNETVYITSAGEKYHRAGCRYIQSRETSTILLSEAKQKYDPCSVCDPP